MKSILLGCVGLLFSFSSLMFAGSQAVALPNKNLLKPLFFQADKNNLQVLPQRFEYALVDENRLRIGDILIDASQLSFQIIQASKDSYRLSFRWPAGLLMEGEILIKDNGGKAFFSSVIDRKKVKVMGNVSSDFAELRSEIAEYTSPEIPKSMLNDMRYLPYMTFCVFREEAQTRIYLCSKEIYMTADKNAPVTVKTRSATNRQPQVEINGRVVGNQGMIFLNDAEENLVLKAYSQSGAVLEIETRKNDVDFKDVIATDDGKDLILTASGTEPVDPKKVKMLKKGEWQITLPADRPFVYLKGDGDIPMRQEFLVKGPLPTEKDRAYVGKNAIYRTYSSSIKLTGYLSDNTTAIAGDKDSELRLTQNSQFLWNLQDISSGTKNRRYVAVKSGNNKFMAGYDVFRGKPFEIGLDADYLTPQGIAYGNLHFSWWVEDFFFINSAATHLRWGIELEKSQHLTSKTTEAKIDTTTAELYYRFNSGFYHEDDTWGLTLPLQMMTIQSESVDPLSLVATTQTENLSLIGLGLFTQQSSAEWMSKWMSWYNLKFDYFMSSSGSDLLKVKSAYKFDFVAYKPLSASWFLNYGLDYSQYKFDPAAAKEAGQIGLSVGTSFRF